MSAATASRTVKSKLGADSRKVTILAVLVVIAVVLFLYDMTSGSSPSPAPAGLTAHTSTALPATGTPATVPPRRKLNQRSSERNVLRMRAVTAEAQRGNIDPTLRLDLLERLQNVQPTSGMRSLFEAGTVAAPQPVAIVKAPKIIPGPLPQAGGTDPSGVGAPSAPVSIPLKFYGFSAPANSTGPRHGFFLDGDIILIAAEGEVMKDRYRVVNLSSNSAQVEDMQTKSQQSLPLTPEVQNAGF